MKWSLNYVVGIQKGPTGNDANYFVNPPPGASSIILHPSNNPVVLLGPYEEWHCTQQERTNDLALANYLNIPIHPL